MWYVKNIVLNDFILHANIYETDIGKIINVYKQYTIVHTTYPNILLSASEHIFYCNTIESEYVYFNNGETYKSYVNELLIDKECMNLCNALNSLKGISTTESCCGHNKTKYRI